MAFLAQDPNEQQQDPNNPQANQVAGQGVTVGGGANTSGVLGGSGEAGAVGANASSGTSGSSPKGTSSGSFTNLQNYVTANQGNDTQMGQAVQGTVQGAQTQADQAGSQFQNDAQTKINSQTVQQDPNLVNSLKSGDVSKVDKDTFGKQYNAKNAYTGPQDATGFDNFATTANAYNNVQNYGKEAGGDTGQRQQLLQDTYGKGGNQYNQGESALDSFVLGTGQDGAKALSNINTQYGNYADKNFGTPTTGADGSTIYGKINGLINGAQTTNAATQQAVQDAAKQGFQTFHNDQGNGVIDQAAAQAKQASDSAGSQYSLLTNGDAGALKKAGLSDDAIKYLSSQGANWNSLVNAPTGPQTAGDYLKSDDVSRYHNLLSLVNGAAPGTFNDDFGNQLIASGNAGPSLRADALSAANNLGTLNTSISSALTAKQADSDKQLQNLQQQLGFVAHPGTSLVGAAPQLDALSKQLGVDPATIQKAAADGIDLTKYLSGGNKYQVGDVANAGQVAQFNSLSKMLGLGSSINQGGTTPGFRYDANGLQSALADYERQHPVAAPAGPQDLANDSGRGRATRTGNVGSKAHL